MNTQSRTAVIVLGVFTLLAMLLFTWLSIEIGGWGGVGKNYYIADFNNVTGLVPQSDVKIAGISVGKVGVLELTREEKARITITLDSTVHIRQGTIAIIKSKSLLGEMFLELQPAPVSAPILPPGSTIERTVSPLRVADIGEIIGPFADSLDPEKVRKMLDSLFSLIDDNASTVKLAGDKALLLLDTLNSVVTTNEGRINRILQTGDRVGQKLETSVLAHADELEGAILALARSAPAIEHLVHSLESVASTAPQTVTEATELIRELRTLTAQLNQDNLLRALQIFKMMIQSEGVSVDLLGRSDESVRDDLNVYRTILEKPVGTPAGEQ